MQTPLFQLQHFLLLKGSSADFTRTNSFLQSSAGLFSILGKKCAHLLVPGKNYKASPNANQKERRDRVVTESTQWGTEGEPELYTHAHTPNDCCHYFLIIKKSFLAHFSVKKRNLIRHYSRKNTAGVGGCAAAFFLRIISALKKTGFVSQKV